MRAVQVGWAGVRAGEAETLEDAFILPVVQSDHVLSLLSASFSSVSRVQRSHSAAAAQPQRSCSAAAAQPQHFTLLSTLLWLLACGVCGCCVQGRPASPGLRGWSCVLALKEASSSMPGWHKTSAVALREHDGLGEVVGRPNDRTACHVDGSQGGEHRTQRHPGGAAHSQTA